MTTRREFTESEITTLKGLGREVCTIVAYAARRTDKSTVKWTPIKPASATDPVDLYVGECPVNDTLTFMCGVTRVRGATVEKIAGLLNADADQAPAFHAAFYGDLSHYEKLVSIRAQSKQFPRHAISVKTATMASPSRSAAPRDFVYLEAQEDIMDTTRMTRGWVCAMHSIDYAPLPGQSTSAPRSDAVRGRLFRSGIVATETQEDGVVEVTYLLQVDFGGAVSLDIRRHMMALRLQSLRFLNDHFRNSHDMRRVRSTSSAPPVVLPARPTSATVGADPSVPLNPPSSQSNPNGQGSRSCTGCGSKFHLLQRKYHCRACGDVFCSHCGVHQRLAPGLGGEKFSLCHACASRDKPSNNDIQPKRTLLMLENGRRSMVALPPAASSGATAPPPSAGMERMRSLGASSMQPKPARPTREPPLDDPRTRFVAPPQKEPSFLRGRTPPLPPSRAEDDIRHVAPSQDEASFLRGPSPPSFDSSESFYLGATPPPLHDRSIEQGHHQRRAPRPHHHHHTNSHHAAPDEPATSSVEGTVVNLGDIGNASDALAALASGQPLHASAHPVVPAPDSPVARGPSPRASASFLENEADTFESLVDTTSEWRGQVEPIRRPRRGSAVVDLRDIKNASELLQKLEHAEVAKQQQPPFLLPTPHSSRPPLAQLANHAANSDPAAASDDDDETDPTSVPPSQRTMKAATLPQMHANEDAVTFRTFAPPCVSREAAFDLTLWAYVVHNNPGGKLKVPQHDSENQPCYVPFRRGALVHVTMAGPAGFRIAADAPVDSNDEQASEERATSSTAAATFTWVGDSTKLTFSVQGRGDHDIVKLGQAVFTATIAVGTCVVVMRSFVFVTSNRGESFEVAQLRHEADVVPPMRRHIRFHDLRLGTLESHAPSGLSYRADWRGQEVVVRLVRSPVQPTANHQDKDQLATNAGAIFQRKAAMLTVLGHHPHIESVLGASTDVGEPWAVVSESGPHEHRLDVLLHQNHHYSSLNSPETLLSAHDKGRILCDIALGLLNVHEAGYVVRDVTTRHCLVDTVSRRAKLADLDLFAPFSASTDAAPHNAAFEHDTNMAALKYFAPESLQPPHEFSFKSDVYSFGVLMWETFTEARPFGNLTAAEAAAWVVEGGRLDHVSDIPVDHRDLLVQCFQEIPSKRPSVADIVAHFRMGATATKWTAHGADRGGHHRP